MGSKAIYTLIARSLDQKHSIGSVPSQLMPLSTNPAQDSESTITESLGQGAFLYISVDFLELIICSSTATSHLLCF